MFESTDVLPFLPTVSAAWLSLIPGIILYVYLLNRKAGSLSEPLKDRLLSSFLIAVIIYKLWPVVESPGMMMNHPSLLLYYSGGAWGTEAAAVGAVLWFWWKHRQSPVQNGLSVLHWLLTGGLVLRLVSSLLIKEHGIPLSGLGWPAGEDTFFPVHFLRAVLYGVLLWRALFLVSRNRFTRRSVGELLAGTGAAELLSASFKPPGPLLWGLSGWEWTGLAALLAGLALFVADREKKPPTNRT
ncbi:hypothetical protein [Staphylospora marina]|uniref:hypothetical protein n=1 Tax=Staphylospora marina TaxID=2490858 RepID=UPI000F5C055A|nr:hypothetical protein [Staphylospora marina]